jgi:hypothetical protein
MIELFILLFFVVVIVGVLLVTYLRNHRQRVDYADGRLVSTDGVGPARGIPLDRIGTILYIPENDAGLGQYKMGVFDYGGLIILDKSGRLIKVIRHYAGSKFALEPLFDSLKAPTKVQFAGRSRKDLLAAYPKSIGFFRFRGQLFWAGVVVVIVFAPFVIASIVALIVIGIGVFGNS